MLTMAMVSGSLMRRESDARCSMLGVTTRGRLVTVATADLVARWRVGEATAAVAGVVLLSRVLAVQNAVTTPALAVVVDRCAAAERVRAERALAQPSSAADMAVLPVRLVAAARVMFAVDHRSAATSGIRAVRLADSLLTAAIVRAIVVSVGSTAPRIPTVRSASHHAVAAHRVPVIHGEHTATRC